MATLNEKLSFLVASVTDVAVMVGLASGPVGVVAGGVYVAEKLGAALGAKVPQDGEHGPAVLVSAQVTPALAASLVTAAFTVTGGPPTSWLPNLFWTVTEIGGATIVKLKLSLLLASA